MRYFCRDIKNSLSFNVIYYLKVTALLADLLRLLDAFLHLHISFLDHLERLAALGLVLHVPFARLELLPAGSQLVNVLAERVDP